MAEYQVKLACDIIKEHFGVIVENVANALMYHGKQTLQQLQRRVRLTETQIREALLVGLQHNFISVNSEHLKSSDSILFYYSVLIDNVIIRIRFPRFILHVKNKFGEMGEMLIEELLCEGRMTLSELEKRVVNRVVEFRRRACLELNLDETSIQQQVHDIITRLVNELYIARAPIMTTEQLNTTSESRNTSSTTSSKLNESFRSKSKKRKEEPEKIQKSTSKKSKTKSTDTINNNNNNNNNNEHVNKDENNNNDDCVLKTLELEFGLESTASSDIISFEDNVQYCVNYERFIQEFLKEACIQLAVQCYDERGGNLLREVFNLLEPKLRQRTVLSDCVVTEEQLLDQVNKWPEDQRLRLDQIHNYIDLWTKGNYPFLTRMPNNPNAFLLHISSMVSQLRHKLVESVVAMKFGEPSLRIWRLLWLKRHLEQKQISEMALLPLKEARDRLYTMLAHDFVHLQEIPRNVNDYTPGKVIYLWSVRWEQVELLIRHEMYKAMHNIKLRLFHHLEENRELLLKSEGEERLLHGEGAQISLLTPQEKQTLHHLRLIQDTLQHSLLKIDESLMVLKDFPT